MKELPKTSLAIKELKDVVEAMSNLAVSKKNEITANIEIAEDEKKQLRKKCDTLDTASKDMMAGIDKMINKLNEIVVENGNSNNNN